MHMTAERQKLNPWASVLHANILRRTHTDGFVDQEPNRPCVAVDELFDIEKRYPGSVTYASARKGGAKRKTLSDEREPYHAPHCDQFPLTVRNLQMYLTRRYKGLWHQVRPDKVLSNTNNSWIGTNHYSSSGKKAEDTCCRFHAQGNSKDSITSQTAKGTTRKAGAWEDFWNAGEKRRAERWRTV